MPASSNHRCRASAARSAPALLWALVWLGGTAAITGFSVTRHAPALEQAMLEEVQRAVAPLGGLPVTISIEDHAVTLAGTVPDAARRDALLGAASGAPGIRSVTDRLVVREPLPDGIGTSGDATSVDEAGDGPAEAGDADTALQLADVTDRADAPLEDDPSDADIPSDDPAATVPSAADVGAAPGNGVPPTAAAPVLPSLRFDVTDGVLTIDGELSSADDPSALIESAMDSFELDFVSNAVETRDGVAEADWLAPLIALLPTLGRLDAAGVEVSERRVTLRGSAADSVTRDEVIEATLERLGDYSLVERILVRETTVTDNDADDPSADRPSDDASDDADGDAGTDGSPAESVVESSTADTAESAARTPATASAPASDDDGPSDVAGRESLLAELDALPSLRVLFRSGSERLTEESLDTLDTIADVLRRHPDVPVTIGGHTDAAGSPNVNLQLSQLRANAVREYLVTRGVQRERLIARGYGESLPIADNATADGRATNRRIEFTY